LRKLRDLLVANGFAETWDRVEDGDIRCRDRAHISGPRKRPGNLCGYRRPSPPYDLPMSDTITGFAVNFGRIAGESVSKHIVNVE
jgi:hypothetical protein